MAVDICRERVFLPRRAGHYPAGATRTKWGGPPEGGPPSPPPPAPAPTPAPAGEFLPLLSGPGRGSGPRRRRRRGVAGPAERAKAGIPPTESTVGHFFITPAIDDEMATHIWVTPERSAPTASRYHWLKGTGRFSSAWTSTPEGGPDRADQASLSGLVDQVARPSSTWSSSRPVHSHHRPGTNGRAWRSRRSSRGTGWLPEVVLRTYCVGWMFKTEATSWTALRAASHPHPRAGRERTGSSGSPLPVSRIARQETGVRQRKPAATKFWTPERREEYAQTAAASAGCGLPRPTSDGNPNHVWFTPCRTTGLRSGPNSAAAGRRVHVVGKDITRFPVIWPAMLEAAGEALPEQVWAHGFIYLGGDRFSKSAGVRLELSEAIAHHGPDALRYFRVREVGFSGDGEFSWERFDARYNSDLADGLGNLASRSLAMIEKYRAGVVPEAGTPLDAAGPRGGARRPWIPDLKGGAEAAWSLVGRRTSSSSGAPGPWPRRARRRNSMPRSPPALSPARVSPPRPSREGRGALTHLGLGAGPKRAGFRLGRPRTGLSETRRTFSQVSIAKT